MSKKKPIDIPPSTPFIIGGIEWEWKFELKDGKLRPQMYMNGAVKIKEKKDGNNK